MTKIKTFSTKMYQHHKKYNNTAMY